MAGFFPIPNHTAISINAGTATNATPNSTPNHPNPPSIPPPPIIPNPTAKNGSVNNVTKIRTAHLIAADGSGDVLVGPEQVVCSIGL